MPTENSSNNLFFIECKRLHVNFLVHKVYSNEKNLISVSYQEEIGDFMIRYISDGEQITFTY